MKLRIAFAGFRHGHIVSMYNHVKNRPDEFEIVATCEENPDACQEILGGISLTHTSIDRMLDEVNCDAVAIGDYYAKRGSIAVRALKHGRHVISDKPLCTSMEDLEEIRRLAKEKNLSVGCMFDLRGIPAMQTARQLIQQGKIGRVTQVNFTAQHPLNVGVRPSWYFEEGKHGGTINDIACHAVDLIPWMTASPFKRPVAARLWKAFEAPCNSFKDGAQIMFELENGCGVIGDVSYAAPNACAFSLPSYWRFNFWGTEGMMEFNCGKPNVTLFAKMEKLPQVIACAPAVPDSYLTDFANEVKGLPTGCTTAENLATAQNVLSLQAMGDANAE